MTRRKKIILLGSVAVLGIAAFLVGPSLFFSFAVGRSLREQRLQNEGAKPLFDAVVTKKLKAGDSLEHAKEVLSNAGLGCDVVRAPFPRPMIQSIYHAGPWSGFTIQLELDTQDRISKVDIHEYFTGP
ncbi:MAG TPA: hypothetical protein VHD85_16175 [Terracidiphilus sp.]|nr:hypothetical protein [Terracidiphilus sp.]